MSCIKAVSMILRNTGGRIVAIVGNDSFGEGSSQVKEGIKMYGTTEEASLYVSLSVLIIDTTRLQIMNS